MANINSYNSTITRINNYSVQLDYKKNYSPKIQYVNSYSVIMDGAVFVDTLYTIFRQNNLIYLNQANFNTKTSASIVLNDIAIYYSASTLSLNSTINSSISLENRIYATPTVNIILDPVLFYGTNSMAVQGNSSINISGSLVVSDVVIDSTQIFAAQYYMLSDWDGFVLTNLDFMNLEDLDFVVIYP